MTLGSALLVHLAITVGGVTVVWLLQLRTRNAGVIDAVWPVLIGAGAVLYAAVAPGDPVARSVVAALGALWALRLGGYLALRNVGKPEDRRYAELRAKWGQRADGSMYLFFLFQAAVAWLMALTFLPIAWRPDAPGAIWLIAGISGGLAGIVGEGLADRQLRNFKRNPAHRGQVCDVGLWRYSRHPNYFFESLYWLAYPLLALGAPYGWVSLVGPALITVLLLKVSGIPTVEGAHGGRRRQGYESYVRRTSAFIPWPPKRGH